MKLKKKKSNKCIWSFETKDYTFKTACHPNIKHIFFPVPNIIQEYCSYCGKPVKLKIIRLKTKNNGKST